MSGIINSLLPASDAILGIRDSIGAVIQPVYFVTRTWYQDAAHVIQATELGGYFKDTEVQMLPSPGLKNFSQDIRLREGGTVKAGDIILTNVSRNTYKEADLDGRSPSKNVEKLYRVGLKLYQVINLTESYLTWNVQLRQLSNQER